MPAVWKQQFPSACEKIIFSFSDSLLNGNFGEYIFMACKPAGLDFTPRQQTALIRAENCLCFPEFDFHSWLRLGVGGFTVAVLPLSLPIYRQVCRCTVCLTRRKTGFMFQCLQVSRCPEFVLYPSCSFSGFCGTRCFCCAHIPQALVQSCTTWPSQ